MQAFVARWDDLAKQAPAGIRSEVKKVADAGRQIVDGVTVSRTIDDTQDVELMTSVAGDSGVPAWHAEYCGCRDTPGIRLRFARSCRGP